MRTVYDDYLADDTVFDLALGDVAALTGTDVFNGDTFALAGVARNFGALTINQGMTLENTVTFSNFSTVAQNADIVTASAGDAVRIRNFSAATWTLAANVAIGASQAGLTFANFGTLQQGLDQTNAIGGVLDNYATVSLDGGVLDLDGAPSRFLGEITGPGDIEGDDVVLNDTTITQTDLVFQQVIVKGAVTDTGSFGEASTQLKLVDSTLTFPGATSVGQALSLPPVTFAATVYGAGQIDFDAKVDIADLTLEGSAAGAPSLTNDDVVTQGATTGSDTPDPVITLDPIDNQTITITNASGGASWTTDSVAGRVAAFTSAHPANAFFVNDSLFQNDGSLPTLVAVSFVNNGFVNGDFTFDDAVTGSGFFEFSHALTFNASVSSGQFVEFVGVSSPSDGQTLTLGDIQDFSALIEGFDQQGRTGDALVVNSSTWAFAGFTPSNLAPSVGGTMMFSDGASQLAVTLQGGFSASGFHASVSGSQTTITYTPPA